MMRSLYSGVAGLNNHQTWLDVISNNVSNVNTHGFKKNRVGFEDIIYQQLSSAASPTAEKGGINPKQIGLGMKIAAIDTIHTQGALQTTGVVTDLAIMGSGFFIEQKADETFYSRAGSFSLDAEGNLVNPANGYNVQGYLSTTDENNKNIIDFNSGLQDLVIPIGEKKEAIATTIVNYRSNLNKLTNPALGQPWTSSIKVVDSLGEKQELQISFNKSLDANGVPIPNEWLANLSVFDSNGNPIENINGALNGENAGNSFIIRFNNAGAIASIVNPLNLNTVVGAPGETLNLNLNYDTGNAQPMNIALNLGTSGQYDGITQFASKSTTKAFFQNGVGMGYLEGFGIDSDGIIIGTYTNGLKEEIGQVALANFVNPQGLDKIGGTYFKTTFNSGIADVLTPNSQGVGSISAGTLEMSNVDLSTEFTDMIVAQRGFQANSRSITTSDTLLEEILRLKR